MNTGSFMESLSARIAGVTKEQLEQATKWVAKSELGDGINVVGTASDELQRIFFLWRNLDREFERKMHESVGKARFEDDFDQATARGELGKVRFEADMFEKLFWCALRASHPELADKHNLGMGTGWLIYWTQDNEQDDEPRVIHVRGGADLEGLLSGLFRR